MGQPIKLANARGLLGRNTPTSLRWYPVISVMFIAIVSLFVAGNSVRADGNPPNQELTEYRLDSMDKIRLRVFEWRPAIDEVFEWKALNEEYIVGPSGAVSLPLLGSVKARGMTTEQLVQKIGERVREKIGLVNLPMISAELTEFRPFYVSGRVANPGGYPYRPRLNVLQAVAISGGIQRSKELASRIDRELITAGGQINSLSGERRALVFTRARLEAELRGIHTISMPAEFNFSEQDTKALLERENELYKLDQQNMAERIEKLRKRREFLTAEVGTLTDQIQIHRAQIDLAKDELKKVESLAIRKLTTSGRQLNARRVVYELERVGLQLEANRRTVHQNISQAEFDMEDIRSTRRGEAIKELRATELRIKEIDRRLKTANELLLESARYGGVESARLLTQNRIDPVFKILRVSQGQSKEFVASETSYVRPGDIIKVDIDLNQKPLSGAQALGPDASKRGIDEQFRRHSTPPYSRPAAPPLSGRLRQEGAIDSAGDAITSVTSREAAVF